MSCFTGRTCPTDAKLWSVDALDLSTFTVLSDNDATEYIAALELCLHSQIFCSVVKLPLL
jgi:hypothetical protein